MSTNIKGVCRLCAKEDEFGKDLLLIENQMLLDLIKDFLQISIHKDESLPKTICLNCEEKILAMQLFFVESHKTQDFLQNIYNTTVHNIKVEEAVPPIIDINTMKPEVKVEMSVDEVIRSITEEEDYDSAHQNDINEDDFDDLDDVTIATLKYMKKKECIYHPVNEEDFEKLNMLIEQPNPKLKEFIKLICIKCNKKMKSWASLSDHCYKTHKTKAVAYCICGYPVKSISAMYKHVAQHKKIKKKSYVQQHIDVEACNKLDTKDFVKFSCTKCNKELQSWYKLKSHTHRYHKVAPVVNCICGVSLKSKSSLYKHIQDHKNPNVLCCEKCPHVAKSLEALNEHKLKHIPKSEVKLPCSQCDKVFQSKQTLKSHEKSHIPVEERKKYSCEICNLKFTTSSSASSHKRVVHDKIKSYVCDLCGYACGTNGELRQHRAIHSEDKPFACKTCTKTFKTYTNLKTHMDIHEGTSYTCYICSRVLNSRRTLRKHLLVHEEKCKHVCSYCNKAFKRRQTLKVHLNTHTGDKPLSCKWCEERFSYASTLRSHRLRCHPDKLAPAALPAHPALPAHAPHAPHPAHDHHYSVPYTHNEFNIKSDQQFNIKNDEITITKNEVDAL